MVWLCLVFNTAFETLCTILLSNLSLDVPYATSCNNPELKMNSRKCSHLFVSSFFRLYVWDWGNSSELVEDFHFLALSIWYFVEPNRFISSSLVFCWWSTNDNITYLKIEHNAFRKKSTLSQVLGNIFEIEFYTF